ncbi:rhamnulokinase family protein [Myceligenerans cantabricum]
MTAAFVAVDLGATSGRVMLGILHPLSARRAESATSGRGPSADTARSVDGAGAVGGVRGTDGAGVDGAGGTDGASGVGRAGAAARVELVECGRFPNGPVAGDGGLRWDIEALWGGILAGLREAGAAAARRGLEVRGIGIDSWAVDHGFLDDDGALLGRPWCYRDPRTDAARERVYARMPFAEHYAVNGLQDLPFTSVFQLVASAAGDAGRGVTGAARAGVGVAEESGWTRVAWVLLIPDLITWRLTGRRVAEVTNASTTGLLDARTRTWSDAHVAALTKEFPELGDLRARLPEPVEPGTVVGRLLPDIGEATGLAGVPVFAVGSHDTASAVAAVPLPAARGGARAEAAAYISSGTWSLVGLELGAPVLSDASREANFTNELGVDGTVRYLRNVMGLWILNECVREWSEADGEPLDLPALLRAAAREPGGRCLIEVDGEDFLAPGGMAGRVRAAIDRRLSGDVPGGVPGDGADAGPSRGPEDGSSGAPSASVGSGAGREPVPDTRSATVRVVLDSLAATYARVVRRAGELAGVRVTAIHVVGGGSQNDLLNRLTTEATGLPVHAGPVEATALGNLLVQARAAGALTAPDGGPASRADLRATVRASTHLRTYEPSIP